MTRSRIWLLAAALAALAGACKDRQKAAKKPAAQAARAKPIKLPAILAKPAFAYAAKKGSREVSISDVAERAIRSVVNIRSTKAVHRRHPFYNHPFFEGPRGMPPRKARSLGSGVIVSADGVVVTNHHVVRHASSIRVTLANDEEYDAVLVGSDPKSDLAVLRIQLKTKKFQPLPFGDSTKLRLGEVVLAIGNPFGVGQTVTMGIVSAVGRANVGIVDYEDFIQTDAAINPGNSGGALVNMRGELIGINTAILSKTGGSQGIGFAIPSAMARPIMQSLLKQGKVVRGWLGVMIQELNPDLARAIGSKVERGVLVAGVQAGSPAEAAGVNRGDVIVAIDGKSVRSVARLRNRIATSGSGKKVKLKLIRGGASKEVSVTLGELPSDKVARLAPSQGALGGLTVETISDQARRRFRLPPGVVGVVVTAIEPGSVAAVAGMRQGDAVLEVNRRPVTNAAQFTAAYRATRGQLLLLIYRGGTTMYLLLGK